MSLRVVAAVMLAMPSATDISSTTGGEGSVMLPQYSKWKLVRGSAGNKTITEVIFDVSVENEFLLFLKVDNRSDIVAAVRRMEGVRGKAELRAELEGRYDLGARISLRVLGTGHIAIVGRHLEVTLKLHDPKNPKFTYDVQLLLAPRE